MKKSPTLFLEREEGIAMPLLAISLLTLLAAVGLATDIARKQLAQSRLSFAVDAAGLAASSTMNTANLSIELNKYLTVNYPHHYLDTATPTISYTLSPDNKVINVAATTTMPTYFMKLFGTATMTVNAETQITRTADGLEVVLVLDNSGSMASSVSGGSTRMAALKTSALSLVDILYGTGTSIPDLWVGIVPFDDRVNLGASGKTTWIHPSFLPLTGWPGVVKGRHSPSRDTSDDLATTSPYSPDTAYTTYAYYCDLYTYHCPLTPAACTSNANYYCNPYPPPVTPLTHDKATIVSGINAMAPHNNTNIDRGAAWGWHLLSPTWRGEWNSEMNSNGLPLDFGTPHMNKAIVLMSDGENNTMSSNINQKAICDAMKAQGIYIYTIVFGTTSPTAKAVMQYCATAVNYYFYAPTATDLTTAFNAIADSLSNLRVSK